MSAEERRRVLDAIDEQDVEVLVEADGTEHYDTIDAALHTLRTYFGRTGRRIFFAANLGVWYPGEKSFAPDLLAVLDVEPGPRTSWVVAAEGKGIDLALEVIVTGRRRKELERNVAWYARLGITEYFVYDRARQLLLGHRLPDPAAREYAPIEPHLLRLPSHVLGLDLALEEDGLRFYQASARLAHPEELAARLEALVEQAARLREEAALRVEEAERRAEEEKRRADALAAELERLRKGGG